MYLNIILFLFQSQHLQQLTQPLINTIFLVFIYIVKNMKKKENQNKIEQQQQIDYQTPSFLQLSSPKIQPNTDSSDKFLQLRHFQQMEIDQHYSYEKNEKPQHKIQTVLYFKIILNFLIKEWKKRRHIVFSQAYLKNSPINFFKVLSEQVNPYQKQWVLDQLYKEKLNNIPQSQYESIFQSYQFPIAEIHDLFQYSQSSFIYKTQQMKMKSRSATLPYECFISMLQMVNQGNRQVKTQKRVEKKQIKKIVQFPQLQDKITDKMIEEDPLFKQMKFDLQQYHSQQQIAQIRKKIYEYGKIKTNNPNLQLEPKLNSLLDEYEVKYQMQKKKKNYLKLAQFKSLYQYFAKLTQNSQRILKQSKKKKGSISLVDLINRLKFQKIVERIGSNYSRKQQSNQKILKIQQSYYQVSDIKGGLFSTCIRLRVLFQEFYVIFEQFQCLKFQEFQKIYYNKHVKKLLTKATQIIYLKNKEGNKKHEIDHSIHLKIVKPIKFFIIYNLNSIQNMKNIIQTKQLQDLKKLLQEMSQLFLLDENKQQQPISQKQWEQLISQIIKMNQSQKI